MLSDKTKQLLSRPATALVVGGAITALVGDTGRAKIFGMDVPMALAGGIATAGAVEIGQIAHDYILPHIPHNAKWSTTESMILAPIVGGLAYYSLLRMSDPGRFSGDSVTGAPVWAMAAGVGAGAVVASEYAHTAIVEPYLFSKSADSGLVGGSL